MSMKLWNRCILGVALLSLGLSPVFGQATDSATSSTDVLKIGSEIVTQDELTSYGAYLGQLSGGFPLQGKALLDEYILTQLYDKIPTTASLPSEQEKLTASPYVKTEQRDLLKRAVQQRVLDNTDVPRAELEAWYTENKERYQKPERVFAWHIFMETSEDDPTSAPEKVRQRLEGVKANIDSGTSFTQAANDFSEAASGKNGGEIGYITPRQPIGPLNKPMNPELEDVFFKLNPNTVSDVVVTKHGMHLLYITDKETTRTPTVDDLITSGILPGTLARDHATSKIREMIEESIAKHKGEALPNFADADAITTDTVAFVIGGREMTLGNLNEIFGERFSSYVDSIKNDKAAFRKLMQQGLEDEALVLTAVDLGVAKEPEVARQIDLIGRKVAADARVDAIVNAEIAISPGEIQAQYHKLLEQLRKPEAEGYIVQVDVKQSTETAEQARARNHALQVAEKLSEAMQRANLEVITQQIANQPNDTATTAIAIARHVIGDSVNPMHREFDRAISTIQSSSGVGQPVPMGNTVVVAKVDNRYPGEPIPLAEVEDRIEQMLMNERRAELRSTLIDRLEEAGLVEYLPGASQYGHGSEDADQTTGTATLGAE